MKYNKFSDRIHLMRCARFLFAASLIINLLSCTRHTIIQSNGEARAFKSVEQFVKNSEIFSGHLTGIVLQDPADGSYIFNQNGGKYFTPASNTKLWTLFASLNILGDSIPWMAVQEIDDKTVYFPMADASFLHPFMQSNKRTESYFNNTYEAGDTVYMSLSHYRDVRFGEGWMWDDQSYYFQAEKSAFPIHANSVKITPNNGQLNIYPEWAPVVSNLTTGTTRFREETKNNYFIPKSQDFSSHMPVHITLEYYEAYFNSLGIHLEIISESFEKKSAKIIYSIPVDTMYKYYMGTSDNLIAEHLLLQCSMEKLGYMHTADIIDTLMNNEFKKWKDYWNWSDGSGISRYNLVTPNAMVSMMNAMTDSYSRERIKSILAKGGQGTMKRWYGYEPSRVFAKTGSLRYCHNLTGIILTKQGHELTFSFMHNNFNHSSTIVKEEMARLIDLIVELY